MSSHDHSEGETKSKLAFLTSPAGLVLMVFLAITGAYLWMEHRAHLLGALLWLPLAGCLLMHLFMRHGHGGHGKHTTSSPPPRDGTAS
jgi:hypothetical protein